MYNVLRLFRVSTLHHRGTCNAQCGTDEWDPRRALQLVCRQFYQVVRQPLNWVNIGHNYSWCTACSGIVSPVKLAYLLHDNRVGPTSLLKLRLPLRERHDQGEVYRLIQSVAHRVTHVDFVATQWQLNEFLPKFVEQASPLESFRVDSREFYCPDITPTLRALPHCHRLKALHLTRVRLVVRDLETLIVAMSSRGSPVITLRNDMLYGEWSSPLGVSRHGRLSIVEELLPCSSQWAVHIPILASLPFWQISLHCYWSPQDAPLLRQILLQSRKPPRMG